MNVVGYVRVSTEAQKEGMGPEVQRAGIAAWAKEHGHAVVFWCEDAGVSGAKGLEDRARLAFALAAIKEEQAEGLVVFRVDRLARDLVLQETLIAAVRGYGGQVYSCSPAEDEMLRDDAKDPARKLLRQILGAIAEYERAMIALRMSAGRQAKRAAGGYAGGKPPYGYAAVGGELVPRADEQEILQGIWGLHDQGEGLLSIVRHLNERHLPPRQGQVWHRRSVQDILKRGRPAELESA